MTKGKNHQSRINKQGQKINWTEIRVAQNRMVMVQENTSKQKGEPVSLVSFSQELKMERDLFL